MFCSEGTGGRPDYHRFPVNHIAARKIFDGKTGNSRNVCGVSGGSVGAEGMEADFATGRQNQHQTLTDCLRCYGVASVSRID